MRLRARNTIKRRVSGENLDPITFGPVPSPIRIARRARYARRITSPRLGSPATIPRSRSRSISSTSPASITRALRYTASPVSMLSSPRKRCSPCTPITRSSSQPMSATTATLPDSTTKKS
jgi:hypothetical protein